ncbi:MAG: hypothetical protein JWQ50_3610 [Caballeronia mineralivorans]|jgi:hypothetical protein|nr:hypothetical protein [Caballeronia mineralivorans]MEA3099017.1 hypothetical protein [Caballeronia mineralivorans]
MLVCVSLLMRIPGDTHRRTDAPQLRPKISIVELTSADTSKRSCVTLFDASAERSNIVLEAERDAIHGIRLDDIKQKLTPTGRANYKFAMKSFFIFGALPPLSMHS